MHHLGPDRPLLDAVRATVAYADLFDFPLERREVHRDLIGIAAAGAATTAAVDTLLARGDLAADGAYLVLPGRRGLAQVRAERQARAAHLWPVARRLGSLLGRFPFVRMVALTGSLAAGNPDAGADIDVLIITAPDHLWTVRAMAVALVRLARHGGVHLCPNYLLSTRALALGHRDLFTAHELLQATPLSGAGVYRRLLDSNPWAARWLPNGYRQRREAALALPGGGWFQAVGEGLLAGRLGRRLEGWEGRRKQQRLRGERPPSGTGRFSADICEGHYGRSRHTALVDFARRCRQVGIVLPGPAGDLDGFLPSAPPTPSVPEPPRAGAAPGPRRAARAPMVPLRAS
jgi:hypothetical protein